MMNNEGAFPRLVERIQGGRDDDGALHRRMLELLYEMSRIQRISADQLRESVSTTARPPRERVRYPEKLMCVSAFERL